MSVELFLSNSSAFHHQNNQENYHQNFVQSKQTRQQFNPISKLHQSTTTTTVPLVTLPGGIKRKQPLISQGERDISDMTSSSSKHHYLKDEDTFIGPSPKLCRYEDRMSSKLGNMQISPEKEKKRHSPVSRQQSRPKIEEIVDWDDELLDENVDDLIREAAAAPIVEEPSTTPTLEMEEEHHKKQKKPRKDWNLAIEELESTSVEEGGYEEQGKLNEMLEEAKQQKILLSEELRQIIEQDRHSRSVGITGDGPSLLLGRSLHRSCMELIPYSPSPLSQHLPITSLADSETAHAQTKKVGAEEILDEEVLPDASSSPQIQSAESSPTHTGPQTPQETGMAENGQEGMEEPPDTEEEAMDID